MIKFARSAIHLIKFMKHFEKRYKNVVTAENFFSLSIIIKKRNTKKNRDHPTTVLQYTVERYSKHRIHTKVHLFSLTFCYKTSNKPAQ